MDRMKHRQAQRPVQLTFDIDQQAGRLPTATTLSAANDDQEPHSFDAAPIMRKLTRKEIDRIPVLMDRLDRRRAEHSRVHGVNDNSPDDEACGEG